MGRGPRPQARAHHAEHGAADHSGDGGGTGTRLAAAVAVLEAAEALGRTTLDEWRVAWGDPARRDGPGWEVLRRLSPEIQKGFAAGFQLEATKPAA